MRPSRLVLVAGTGTGVGKTHVSEAVLRHIRDGPQYSGPPLALGARKPAESFDPCDPSRGPTDADRLAAATGEPVEVVCAPERSYPLAMAPPMAAAALGLPAPTVAGLAAWLEDSWPERALDVGLIECAGGVASPQAVDGDCRDLAKLVGPDVVGLVADAGLGTIHAVRLSVEALAGWPLVVFLNRHDPSKDVHRRNLEWLRACLPVPVCTSIATLADHLLVGGARSGVGGARHQ